MTLRYKHFALKTNRLHCEKISLCANFEFYSSSNLSINSGQTHKKIKKYTKLTQSSFNSIDMSKQCFN